MSPIGGADLPRTRMMATDVLSVVRNAIGCLEPLSAVSLKQRQLSTVVYLAIVTLRLSLIDHSSLGSR